MTSDSRSLLLKQTEEESLWRNWMSHREAESRASLFFHYSEWSRQRAGSLQRIYPHPLAEWKDYVSLASLGVLQAIDRFDPEAGVRFQTFAEPFLKGAILKGLACYVKDRQPRSRERLSSLIEEGTRTSSDDFDRVVSAAVELAFGYFLEMGVVPTEPEDNSPLRAYELDRRDQVLAQMVEHLPYREKQIIVGHYFQHLDFSELAKLLEVSRARVSQLHSKALGRVRMMYEKAGDDGGYY